MKSFFRNTRPGKNVTYGMANFDLPILYFRDDFFGLYFTADLDKVQAIMPSKNLHPVVMPNGKAIIAIAAYNYIDTSIGSYGEIPVGIPVVYGKKTTPKTGFFPAMLESTFPGFGVLVQHLPVTKVLARDAGRGEWGYTKFVADMNFKITPEYLGCEMQDNGKKILDIQVMRRGFSMKDNKPLTTYSVKNEELIKTVIPQTGIKRVSIFTKGSFVKFGDHPVAESIKQLGISKKPFMSVYYTERSGILPSGTVVEKNVKPFEGHIGESREAVHSCQYTEYEGL